MTDKNVNLTARGQQLCVYADYLYRVSTYPSAQRKKLFEVTRLLARATPGYTAEERVELLREIAAVESTVTRIHLNQGELC